MFNRLKALYFEGKITTAEINNAVKKGYITAAQASYIIGSKEV